MADDKPHQQELLLSREEKFLLLRQARFQLEGHRLLDCIHRLLEQVELCSGNDGCNARVEVLASRLYRAARTVRYWILLAEQLGVLRVERNPQRTGGQGPNRYWIDWQRVRAFARDKPAHAGTPAHAGPVSVDAAHAGPAHAGNADTPTEDRPAKIAGRAAMTAGRAANIAGRAAKTAAPIDPCLDPYPMSPSSEKAKTTLRAEPETQPPRTAEKGHGEDSRERNNGGWATEITRQQLADPRQVEELYRHAVARKWVGASTPARIQFFALCRLAGRKGQKPGAYLTYMLRNRKFEAASIDDEEWARAAVRKLGESWQSPAQAQIRALAERFGTT